MTHAEYMREWRKAHPEYVERDRRQARLRYKHWTPEQREAKNEYERTYRTTAKGLLTDVRRNRRRHRAREE